MYRKCCICKSSRKEARLHRFPILKDKLVLWLKHLNRDDLNKLSRKEISNLFICQNHFEKRFFSLRGNIKLAAYPSLFTEDEISCGKPSAVNTEETVGLPDHNYARGLHFDHTYCKSENSKAVQDMFASLRGDEERHVDTQKDLAEDNDNTDSTDINNSELDVNNPSQIWPDCNIKYQNTHDDDIHVDDWEPPVEELLQNVPDSDSKCKISVCKTNKENLSPTVEWEITQHLPCDTEDKSAKKTVTERTPNIKYVIVNKKKLKRLFKKDSNGRRLKPATGKTFVYANGNKPQSNSPGLNTILHHLLSNLPFNIHEKDIGINGNGMAVILVNKDRYDDMISKLKTNKNIWEKLLPELNELRAMKKALNTKFSKAQIGLLTKRYLQMEWTEEDKKKVIYLNQIISPKAYAFLKGQMKFPLPNMRTVNMWLAQRNICLKTKMRKSKDIKQSNVGMRKPLKYNAEHRAIVPHDFNLNQSYIQNQDRRNTSDKSIENYQNTAQHNLDDSLKNEETERAIAKIIIDEGHIVDDNSISGHNTAEISYDTAENNVNKINSNNNKDGTITIALSDVHQGGICAGDTVNVDGNLYYVVDDNVQQNNTRESEHDAPDGDNSTEGNAPYTIDESYGQDFHTAHDDNDASQFEDNNVVQYDNGYSNADSNNGGHADNSNIVNEEYLKQFSDQLSKWDLNNIQKYKPRKKDYEKIRLKMSRTCQICLKQFQSEWELEQHVPVHYRGIYYSPYIYAQKPYTCEFCNARVLHKFALANHHISHLGIQEFRCWEEGCSYVGRSKTHLQSHIKTRHSAATHSCPECPAQFRDRGVLRSHFAHAHSARGKYQCTLCDAIFRTEYSFCQHMVSHTKPPRFKCNKDGCSEAFYSKVSLNSHKLTHEAFGGANLLQCPECPLATFRHPSYLKRHMEKHEQFHIMECKHCRRMFDSYSEYYHHMKTFVHTKRRDILPYACYCKQRFTSKRLLRIHRKECKFVMDEYGKMRRSKTIKQMIKDMEKSGQVGLPSENTKDALMVRVESSIVGQQIGEQTDLKPPSKTTAEFPKNKEENSSNDQY